MQTKRSLFLFSFFLLLQTCNEHEKTPSYNPYFQKVSSQQSQLNFANHILENDTLNYYTFPYLYMGGGVTIGDINNDGLSDIFLTGNMVSNKLYLNKGGLQFQDITESAGIGGDQRWYTGSTMVDINNDGWLDIYVCVSGKDKPFNNQLYINNQDNTFSEQASNYGLDDESTSIQATFFDYDQDGLLDCFVANYPQISTSMGNRFYAQKMEQNAIEDSGHLYRNNGDGSFSDETASAGVKGFGLTLGLVASDFNKDGFTDLYLSNDFNVPDYFYLNNGDGTFREIIKESTGHTSMFGMGTDAADFNNDGLLDLAQVDMTPADHKRAKTNMASMSPASFWQAVDMGFHYQYMQNSLQLNNGLDENGWPQFSDISRFAGMATTDWSWGVQLMDLDNNGQKDIFISNGMKRDVNNNDAILQFKETSFFQKEKGDYSKLPSEPLSNYAFQNHGDLQFSNSTTKWGLDEKGFSNGFAFSDLDNDGDLDLVINNLGDLVSLYENRGGENPGNYLMVKLNGPKNNPYGIGTKVNIQTAAGEQFQELTLSRGFQSSVAPILHFGLGAQKVIKKIEVIWPDGKSEIQNDIPINQMLNLSHDEANVLAILNTKKPQRFENCTVWANIDFKHSEDSFNDFKKEPLLPHKNSALGPALAVGDVNGDYLEDFFIGGATGSSGKLFIQKNNGEFFVQKGPWEIDRNFEDTGAKIFDADNDGDQDLYLINGGNDSKKPEIYFQDRLYLNTPKGFIKSSTSLPHIPSSGQEISTLDYDKDGDLDLFIAGRILPGSYPNAPKSFLLRNDGGQDEKLQYTDVTEDSAPELMRPGMVTAVVANDFDQDGWIDLVLTGEWMPIRFFKNKQGKFVQVTSEISGLENLDGWYYGLESEDIDGDGDLDFVAGNLGLNYKYKASPAAPFEIFANDFDENKTLDIVLSYQKKGERLPVRGRECSSEQVPGIAKRFQSFESFANADLPELYGKNMLEKSLHFEAKSFSSCWLENKGSDGFEKHDLPAMAQLSSINTIEFFDYNKDAFPDLLVFGNLYDSEVETPRNDASKGLVLAGHANGTFTAVPASESGVLISGNVKQSTSIKLAGMTEPGFLVARNNGTLQLICLGASE